MIYLIVLTALNLILLVLILIRVNRCEDQGLAQQLVALEKNQERTDRLFSQEISVNRQEMSATLQKSREESAQSLKAFNDSVLARMAEVSGLQKNQMDTFSDQLSRLTQLNEQKFNQMNETLVAQLRSLQQDNGQKLEQMRQTVDEKLHATLEKRLGDSFKLVSDRLEKVHQGLGEMQHLASGVGDLKRVLTNVKTRGTWGEVQLGNLLEELLTSQQYDRNVVTKKGSREQVEYAIKLPGDGEGVVYLPIDAKFPVEDYQRLLDAQDKVDQAAMDVARKDLERKIKMEAKKIRDKYIDPPNTTDFGILFLPTEGLYAEVLRFPGLWDFLQREYRITLAGPTTIAAILNSLQMGFRTLAVEKRASEVWGLLGTVKKEFGKFGDILNKTQTRLRQASDEIESAVKKSRTIESKLKNVQQLAVEEPEE